MLPSVLTRIFHFLPSEDFNTTEVVESVATTEPVTVPPANGRNILTDVGVENFVVESVYATLPESDVFTFVGVT